MARVIEFAPRRNYNAAAHEFGPLELQPSETIFSAELSRESWVDQGRVDGRELPAVKVRVYASWDNGQTWRTVGGGGAGGGDLYERDGVTVATATRFHFGVKAERDDIPRLVKATVEVYGNPARFKGKLTCR